MYIIKSRKEMKDAIDMDRKYYDTQNDLFMKRTNDHLVQIKKYMYCLRHEQYYISKNNKLGRLLRLYWARRKNTIGNRYAISPISPKQKLLIASPTKPPAPKLLAIRITHAAKITNNMISV